ncbi:MAG: hypothetical protein GX879_07825 [Bacteroidales bacterium]|nr:hypothetical protein [Bacteroidales bacterium]
MLSEKLKKLNKGYIGFIIGMILPLIAFSIYYATKSFENEPIWFFIQRLKGLGAYIPALSLCVLPNLILYFAFKNLNYWYAIKGVVASVFVYTLIVVIMKFA